MSMSGKMSVGVRADRERSDEQDQQRQHDERVGPIERDSDDPHGRTPVLKCFLGLGNT